MKITINNWKGLSKVMLDERFNKNPIQIVISSKDKLESLTFKTYEMDAQDNDQVQEKKQ